jgi:hypothetical protein
MNVLLGRDAGSAGGLAQHVEGNSQEAAYQVHQRQVMTKRSHLM